MHIEPGLVDGAKIALSYATAAAAGGAALHHIATATRERGVASVALAILLAERTLDKMTEGCRPSVH